ncbi:HD domain-containing protein (plasmid) [Deinococcus sp. KNUC1210]|uniref:HD domain-containing phosphohydrolase n=1 Tax=Deinococcus sp. KNUC1210 TaxID=2917691 RepID=UPI001EF0FED8|nr:HD domain-containing phosphohydrolase [Deinococcus sp. KNUC1210]ULH18346.1 HD domain-containing protein [Deinococcus sp. KNUC1210]
MTHNAAKPSKKSFPTPNNREIYAHLIDAMPVMLWTADHAGVWLHVNDAWITYTGLIGESYGFGFEEALHPEDEAATLAVWRQAVERHEPYQIEYRLRRQDGVYRWFLVRGIHVADPAGQSVAWVGTCTDIEEQKQAERQALEAREASIRALGLVLEARDHETKGHTDRVTQLSLKLGQALGLNAEQLESLRLGAALHDIGKLATPDAVLLKPGPLNAEEWRIMRGHSVEGERFAASLGFVPPEVLGLIRSHHERWDGGGYADQLSGEDIPLLARIFSVVDVYDALSSERPYKHAWDRTQVIATLRAEAGRQFDPQVVTTFLQMLEQPIE